MVKKIRLVPLYLYNEKIGNLVFLFRSYKGEGTIVRNHNQFHDKMIDLVWFKETNRELTRIELFYYEKN